MSPHHIPLAAKAIPAQQPVPNKPAVQARHAQMLAESLPFVQALHGQTVVIAFLGPVLFDPAVRQRLIEDIALLSLLGIQPVLVQGCAPEFRAAGSAHGMLSTAASAQVVRAAAAEINLELVKGLGQEGIKAVGLSGQDALWAQVTASRAGATHICQMDTSVITLLLTNQMVPVLMSLAPTPEGHDELIPPERFATELAQRLHAHSLLMVNNGDMLQQAGIPEGVISRPELTEWLSTHAASQPASEIRAALDAVDLGVPTVHLVDASAPRAIVAELLTNEGVGTVLCRRSGAQLLADTARYFHDADSVIRANFVAERKGVVRF